MKNEIKHTPGQFQTIPRDLASQDCGCKVRFDGDGFVRWEQCPLHNAAPDLVAVLTDCLDTFSGPAHYLNGCLTSDMRDKCRAAIEKAKSE